MSDDYETMRDVARGFKHYERWLTGMGAVFLATVGMATAGFFSLSSKVDDGLQKVANIDKITAQLGQRLDDLAGRADAIATNTKQIKSSIDLRGTDSFTADEIASHTVVRALAAAMELKGARFLLSSTEQGFAAAMRAGGIEGTPTGTFLIEADNIAAALTIVSAFPGQINVTVNGAPDAVSIIKSVLKAR